MEKDSLRDLIVDLSPKRFWEQLVTRQEGMYSEARSYSFNESLWKEPEAETITPSRFRSLPCDLRPLLARQSFGPCNSALLSTESSESDGVRVLAFVWIL